MVVRKKGDNFSGKSKLHMKKINNPEKRGFNIYKAHNLQLKAGSSQPL